MTIRRLTFLVLAFVFAVSGLAPLHASPAPVVIIFMENKSYVMVLSHAAYVPYEMSFITKGVRFTNYAETPNPSLPNYLNIAAGSVCGKQGTDAISAGQVTVCPNTVWNQLQGVGASWGVYEDAMPSACYGPTNYQNAALDTPYALKHNPATPFASVWSDQSLCKAHVLPFTSFNPAALPAVSFIAPGICNDQHGSKKVKADGITPLYANCYTGSDALYKRGDNWLAANVPAMLAAGATVIITYDGPSTAMYTVEVGPGITPGTTDGAAYSHLSILAAIEDRYGLARLNNAAGATPLPLG